MNHHWHLCFWDQAQRDFVSHDLVEMSHDDVTMISLRLSVGYRAGDPGPLTRHWVAWREDDPEAVNLRLFFLTGYPDLSEEQMESIRAAAGSLSVVH